MLLTFAPGGPCEAYFETLARREQIPAEQRDAMMDRHDTYRI